MPSFLSQLTASDWIQVVAATGQCVSGFGALFAAWFAFLAIRQMKSQSEVMRREFLARHGPQLHVIWSRQNHVSPGNGISEQFPCTPPAAERLHDSKKRQIYQVLAEWWQNPSAKACPMKYAVLSIQNSQGDPTAGIAKNLSGTIEIYVRFPRRGHPQGITSEFDFEIGDCRAGQTLQIPICVKGVPEFSIQLKSLKHYADNDPAPCGSFKGNPTYHYP